MLSNITAVNSVHVAAVVAPNFVPPIIAAFTSGHFFVRDEALRCVHNIALWGSTTERSALLAAGVINALKDAMTLSAGMVVLLALQSVQALLDDPALLDAVQAELTSSEAMNVIDDLQTDFSAQLAAAARCITKTCGRR
jgi:hypothetical protein